MTFRHQVERNPNSGEHSFLHVRVRGHRQCHQLDRWGRWSGGYGMVVMSAFGMWFHWMGVVSATVALLQAPQGLLVVQPPSSQNFHG